MRPSFMIQDKESNSVPILLVDDQTSIRSSVKRSLHQARIINPIIEAENGFEALKKIKSGTGAFSKSSFIILLDIMMPVMDGIDFLKEFKKHHYYNKAVIIVLTASPSTKHKEEVIQFGVKEYIEKGEISEKLVEIIKKYTQQFNVAET